jgi:hypothetical protein
LGGALRFDDFVDGSNRMTRMAWLHSDLFVVLCVFVLGLRCKDSSEVYGGQLSRHSSSNKMYAEHDVFFTDIVRHLLKVLQGCRAGEFYFYSLQGRSGVSLSDWRSKLG